MGMTTVDNVPDYYSGSHFYGSAMNASAALLQISHDEMLQRHQLYQGSGGTIAFLLNPASLEVANIAPAPPENALKNHVSEICTTLGLTRKELAGACNIQSTKTLYNWIKGEVKPRQESLDRFFKLVLLTKEFKDAGIVVKKSMMHQPIVNNKSFFQLLTDMSLNRDLVMFAGNRLSLMNLPKTKIRDPFA
ncbi:MAG: transcriptional regulator with XRE-family HTH domain [Candidatus Endobugula sp.]|jgi:transcriptional regulator with XRE-family HTH domain